MGLQETSSLRETRPGRGRRSGGRYCRFQLCLREVDQSARRQDLDGRRRRRIASCHRWSWCLHSNLDNWLCSSSLAMIDMLELFLVVVDVWQMGN